MGTESRRITTTTRYPHPPTSHEPPLFSVLIEWFGSPNASPVCCNVVPHQPSRTAAPSQNCRAGAFVSLLIGARTMHLLDRENNLVQW